MRLDQALDALDEIATHAGWHRAMDHEVATLDAAARAARDELRGALVVLVLALGMPPDRLPASQFLSTQPL